MNGDGRKYTDMDGAAITYSFTTTNVNYVGISMVFFFFASVTSYLIENIVVA